MYQRCRRLTMGLLASGLLSSALSAQTLAEADIDGAIKLGHRKNVTSLVRSCNVGPGLRGYVVIEVTTNLGMIAIASQRAALQSMPYARADVAEELLQPWVSVTVHPLAPRASGREIIMAPSMTHVVLKSRTKDPVVIQPSRLNIIPVDWTLDGGTLSGTRVEARFDFDTVKKLPAGVFEAVVTTSDGEKKCLVNSKYRKRLKLI